jgi:uncharacterized membrane protein YidH (DUF202 family)
VGGGSGPGSPGANDNGKALVSLVLGILAFASVAVLTGLYFVDTDALGGMGAAWLLLPFFGFAGGGAAAFLGSLGWIDVRRGVTDRRLRQAQFGAILGGIAAGLMVLATIVLIVFLILIVIGLSNQEMLGD